MIHYTCDGCGRALPAKSLRYIAKMDVFAAYDTLEITREELEKDISYEIRRVLEGCGDRDPEELLREVYANFRFDLCPDCHRRFLKDPLGTLSSAQ